MGAPPSDSEDAGLALGGECRRRVCAALHVAGLYFHMRDGRTGMVCCFAAGAEVPEGFAPTEAQRRLWDLDKGGSNDG